MEYKQYQRMIWKLASSFHNTTGLELEELIATANLAFVIATKRFNKDRGNKFGTFLFHTVTNALNDHCKKIHRRPISTELDELEGGMDPEREYRFREFLSNLSKEATDVVQTLLYSCNEVAAGANGHLGHNYSGRIKQSLKQKLTNRARTDIRMSNKQVDRAFREIKSGLEAL